MPKLIYADSVTGQDTLEVPGHAFISYVHEDANRVKRLVRILEAARIKVWQDTADILPGQDWKNAIKDAIKTGSLAFIACFSENSQQRQKTFQNEELILAAEEMRQHQYGVTWLIPVRFANCDIPPIDLGNDRTLRSLHHVDLFGRTWEVGAVRLTTAVLNILGAPTATRTEPPPQDARKPEMPDMSAVPFLDFLNPTEREMIFAARMVEAPALKEAFTGSTARLGVIVSPFVYDTVVRHDQDRDYVASYSQVRVEVKESSTTAWMMLVS